MSSPDTGFLTEGEGFVTLAVKVQPGARKSEIVGTLGQELKVRVASPPVDGAANAALIDFIAKTLHIRTARISIIRGELSRSKILKIEGIFRSEILAALGLIPL